MNSNQFVLHKKNLIGVFCISTLIIIFASGIITGQTKWSLFDFLLAGVLLISTGFMLVIASRTIGNANRRKVVMAAIIATLIIIWAELAVGLFGSPFAGS